MTDQPAVGPLGAEDVKLLVRGDVVCGPAGDVFTFDRAYEAIDHHDRNGAYLKRADGTEFVLKDGLGPRSRWFANLAFIGRPDSDGWIPWSGGENPVPGRRVDVKTLGTGMWADWLSDQWGLSWLRGEG